MGSNENTEYILSSLFDCVVSLWRREDHCKRVEIDMKDESGSKDEFEEGVSWDAFEEELKNFKRIVRMVTKKHAKSMKNSTGSFRRSRLV